MRPSFFRNLVHFTSTHPLVRGIALTAALAGCSGETKGQVILALQTDMSLPEDVSKVKIQVNENGTTRYENTFIVDPNAPNPDKIPSTLAVVAGEKESPTVELTVIAFRDKNDGSGDLEARTLNKSVTTIPKDRVAMLRVPMQWLCTGTVDTIDADEGIYESNCKPKNGKETACVGGTCEEVHIDSAKLPDFNQEEVFGGSEKPSNGTCFPTEDCFDAGEDIPLADIDTSDCTVAYDPPNDSILNFGLVTDGSGGICRNGICYVGIDKSRDFGWYELDSTGERRFQMPKGVCDRLDPADGRVTSLRASTSTSCVVTKTPKYPTCGPWSPIPAGDKPLGNDADSDGFDSKKSGGKDCDDNDPTVYPNAPELCDSKDNNCDMQVDNNCRADLPFSHYVDFSATTNFTSTSDYAIYQDFSAETPFDLDQKTLTFTPRSNHTSYTVDTGALEWDSDVGELVPNTQSEDVSSCDDCFTELPLEFPFDFYGTEYQSVFPSSNGYLTFSAGDDEYNETVEYFLTGFPRIAAFFDDLDTSGERTDEPVINDEVRFFSSSSKIVVTYLDIQGYPQTGTSNTFQFVLLSDGTIKISYDGIEDRNETSLAGISPGSIEGGGGVTCPAPYVSCSGSCVDTDTDPANCGACGNLCANGLCAGGQCAGEVSCLNTLAPCDGLCVGVCSHDSTGTCDGTCQGTCEGTCSPDDGSGECAGTCSGNCIGTCYVTVSGESCADDCTGDCYLDTGMTCYDPTPGAKGPCSFSGSQIMDPTYCSDFAFTESGAGYVVNCSDGLCHCCKQNAQSQVCSVMASTSDEVCASESTLRRALLDECMQDTVCGAGCPTSAPANGDPCDDTEVSSCSYQTVFCSCVGSMFSCN